MLYVTDMNAKRSKTVSFILGKKLSFTVPTDSVLERLKAA